MPSIRRKAAESAKRATGRVESRCSFGVRLPCGTFSEAQTSVYARCCAECSRPEGDFRRCDSILLVLLAKADGFCPVSAGFHAAPLSTMIFGGVVENHHTSRICTFSDVFRIGMDEEIERR